MAEQTAMDINAKGVFLCSQAAAKVMATQPMDSGQSIRGKIINIASMAGKRGNAPYLSHYDEISLLYKKMICVREIKVAKK